MGACTGGKKQNEKQTLPESIDNAQLLSRKQRPITGAPNDTLWPVLFPLYFHL